MAPTPTPPAIHFSHTSPQQSFRLLELPPDLLELLSSKDAPTLHFKSPPEGSGGYVNLCTPTQSYFLRQVHSSNSIFLIRPNERLGANQNGKDEAVDNNKFAAVTAVGLCKSTLELQKIKDPESGVRQAMRSRLRVYDVDDMEADEEAMDVDASERHVDSRDRKNRILVGFFADTPFSTAECEKAWVEMCGFVHHIRESGKTVCWVPTAQVLLSLWKKILEGAVLEGIDLGTQFLTRDLWRSVEGSVPKGLFDAVLQRLMDDSSAAESGRIYSDIKWASLNSDKLVSWTGEVYLQATAPTPSSAISQPKYLDGWKDLLPEHLRKEASLDKIQNYYRTVGSGICYRNTAESEQPKNVA
ncbi:hypothetical protein VTO42DRAFT_6070 [Malbranchea cinnamomea]